MKWNFENITFSYLSICALLFLKTDFGHSVIKYSIILFTVEKKPKTWSEIALALVRYFPISRFPYSDVKRQKLFYSYLY